MRKDIAAYGIGLTVGVGILLSQVVTLNAIPLLVVTGNVLIIACAIKLADLSEIHYWKKVNSQRREAWNSDSQK